MDDDSEHRKSYRNKKNAQQKEDLSLKIIQIAYYIIKSD